MTLLSPDCVMYNANIITMNVKDELAEMIGIKNGKIIYVGKHDSKLLNTGAECWDLENRSVLPGFIDLHTHLWYEADKIFVDLGTATQLDQALEILAREVTKYPPGKWIFAKNWDESRWTDHQRFLNRDDLDGISEDHLIYASREDGHLVTVNSAALKALNVPNSHVGLEKDASGRPTGILKDVWVNTTPYYKDRLPANILASCELALSRGITAVVDNLKITAEGQEELIKVYMMLDREDNIPLRVFLNFRYNQVHDFVKLGLTNHWGSSNIQFSGFKGFYDGAIGAQTALVSKEYEDENTLGDRFIDPEELLKIIDVAEQHAFTICIHAIGDQAIDELLDCFETVLKKSGKEQTTNNHRIEHAEMISDSQVKRASRLGIWLSMQPNFLKWQYPKNLYEQRLGSERYSQLNRFRRILDLGGLLAFGSDNMPLNPLYGIEQAVSYPSEDIQITPYEAIKCYTLNCAKALKIAHKIGSIEVDKLADLVILSTSPLDASPNKIHTIDVDFSLVNGRIVFKR